MNEREMRELLAKGEDPLEVSIKKWEDIVTYLAKIVGRNAIYNLGAKIAIDREINELEQGMDNCALCACTRGCKNCPISSGKREGGCGNSPYEDWAEAHITLYYMKGAESYRRGLISLLRAAIEEKEFLESKRLKEGETPYEYDYEYNEESRP